MRWEVTATTGQVGGKMLQLKVEDGWCSSTVQTCWGGGGERMEI